MSGCREVPSTQPASLSNCQHRRYYMVRISDGQVEAGIPMTPREAGDERGQHIVTGRETGAELDVQRPVRGAGLNITNPVQHLDRGRQQFTPGRVPHDPAAVPVK